jgi:hypothetical protein
MIAITAARTTAASAGVRAEFIVEKVALAILLLGPHSNSICTSNTSCVCALDHRVLCRH